MAVSPISSASFRNNYNQVNFEGKKKEKVGGVHASNTIKAIPLATLIALSPLNNVEAQSIAQNSKVADKELVVNDVSKKTYEPASLQNGIKRPIIITYRDLNKNAANIECVIVETKGTQSKIIDNGLFDAGNDFDFNEIYGDVSSLEDYTFDIVGDDGNSLGDFAYSQVNIKSSYPDELGDRTIANPKIIEDLRNFSKTGKNNAFEVKQIHKLLVPKRSYGGMTSADKVDTDWIGKNNLGAPARLAGGKANLLKFHEYKTPIGNYHFGVIPSSSNPNRYEAVIIRRDDGLLCRINSITETTYKIKNSDGFKNEDITEFFLDAIHITAADNKEYTIYDQYLVEGMRKDPKCKYLFNKEEYGLNVNEGGFATSHK